jgi:hypothetical protein
MRSTGVNGPQRVLSTGLSSEITVHIVSGASVCIIVKHSRYNGYDMSERSLLCYVKNVEVFELAGQAMLDFSFSVKEPWLQVLAGLDQDTFASMIFVQVPNLEYKWIPSVIFVMFIMFFAAVKQHTPRLEKMILGLTDSWRTDEKNMAKGREKAGGGGASVKQDCYI